MKCREARDILIELMDGQDEPREALAMEHVQDCAECYEWHCGMQQMLNALEASKTAIPNVDLSDAIMASLPARHPASCRTAPAPASRKLVIIMAAFWLLGAIMMAAGIGVWAYYCGGSPHEAALSVKTAAGAAESAVKTGWSASSATLSLALYVFIDILVKGAHGIVAFFVIDILFLLLAAVIWWKRRMLTGPYSILS